MTISNKVFPITKYPIDENESFSFFRSFVTFYYYITILIRERYFEKNKIDLLEINENNKKYIKKLFEICYNSTKYFDFFYECFFIEKNILVFTYFNITPPQFLPYPEEIYYYYPLINFYNSSNFFQKGNISFTENYFKYLRKQIIYKISDEEIQTTIPLEFLKKYQLPEKYFIMLKIKKNFFIITNNIKYENNKIILKNFYFKFSYWKEYKISSNGHYFFNDIIFASILQPITKEGIEKVFKLDEIKKDCLLYSVATKKKSLEEIRFYGFYPVINMVGEVISDKWYCTRTKLKKNIKTLNLTVDIFYNNIILKDSINKKFKFLDYKESNYNKFLEDDFFRCTNFKKVLANNKNICNFTIRKDNFNKDDLKNNLGKNMLNLIIFNNLYGDYKFIYYLDFLKKLNFDHFVYSYGYDQTEEGDEFINGTEIGFPNNNISQYIEIVDNVEGECQNLYKKCKLINE